MASELARRKRFETLYTENYHRLVGYALRRTKTADDAADVVAATFLVAWRRLDELPPGDEARLWLYGAARKVIANLRRGERRQSQLAERLRGDMADALTLAGPADGGAELHSVIGAFNRLRPEDREILALVAWEDLDRSELATVLGCSRNAVRIRLHRARRRFALELERFGDPRRRRPAHTSLRAIPKQFPARAGGEEVQ